MAPLDAPGSRAAAPRSPQVAWPVTVGVGIALGLVITVLGSGALGRALTFRTPEGFAAVETAFWLVSSFGAVLLYGRVVRSGSSSEFALMVGLLLLAIGEFVGVLAPAIVDRDIARWLWGAELSRLLAAAGLAVAALAPARTLSDPRRTARLGILAAHAVVAAIAIGVLTLGQHLPGPPPSGAAPLAHLRVTAGVGLETLQVTILLLYAAAAVGFLHTYLRCGDRLLAWLAAVMVLGAFSRLNACLVTFVDANWVSTGDLFRMASALALLAGVVLEIRANQEQLATEAVQEERRRLARDLHDSLAQDLAFIRSQSDRLADAGVDAGRVVGIAEAAQRALDESRSTITLLSRPAGEPLAVTLEQVVAEIAHFGPAAVAVDVQADVAVDERVREALIRITREAVANAIRHGGARNVLVHLRARQGVTLRIVDDGDGFDLEAPTRPGAYGLTSIRQRATALGGRADLSSAPGAGTTVLVRLP